MGLRTRWTKLARELLERSGWCPCCSLVGADTAAAVVEEAWCFALVRKLDCCRKDIADQTVKPFVDWKATRRQVESGMLSFCEM